MENDLFSFQWEKHTAGYIISEIDDPLDFEVFAESRKSKRKIQIISGKGKKKILYPPLQEKDLHRKFAAIGDSSKDVLSFVKEFGFLGLPTKYFKESEKYYERIDVILNARTGLQRVMSYIDMCYGMKRSLKQELEEMTEEGRVTISSKCDPDELYQIGADYFNKWASDHNMQRMKVMLAPTGNKKELTWKVVPQTLLSTMWLMAAEEIIGGIDKGARLNRRCVVCNAPIQSDANINKITCSGLCRKNRSLQKNKK